MTHALHPLNGCELDVLKVQMSWGIERVYCTAEDGTLAQVPRASTSLAPPDPFMRVAAGRSNWRLEDLLALLHLLDELM